MPRRWRRWGSACSTTWRWERCRRAPVHGLSRLAIFDFDVHHGNGTQAIFWDDPDTLYVSTHQSPLYPGTGPAEERGIKGNILNRPLPPGTGSEAWRRVVERAFCRRSTISRPTGLHLGRVRRAHGRPAGEHGAGRGRFRLGDREAGRGRSEAHRREARLDARRRLRLPTSARSTSGVHVATLMGA